MKVTQYNIGNGYSEQIQVPVSEKMAGAIDIRATERVISDDFLGFGVAITGSSCYELNTMTPEARKKLLNEVYSREGLNFSVGRLSIGASDYSPEMYSYDDTVGDVSLEHFSIERDKAYIIPMIKEILKVRPDLYLYASPWSPPGWMKTGGTLCDGFMRDEYIDCYAEYIIRYLLAYEAEGIHISALTVQNETEQKQRGLMPACIWHPDTEAKFITVLKNKLRVRKMDVEVWMYDYNFDGTARVDWMLTEHRDLLQDCDGIAFHYYRGAVEDTAFLRTKYPKQRLHFTEGGPRLFENYGTDHCKWAIMAAKVLNCGYRSFTGWNLLLDEHGRPNIGPYFCGGLITLDSKDGHLSYSGQYRSLELISHHFAKGAKVLEAEIDGNRAGMNNFPKQSAPVTVSAYRTADGKTVYLLVNQDTAAKRQVEIYESGAYRYIELLPDTVAAVVFDESK